jgi:TPR repeat protein
MEAVLPMSPSKVTTEMPPLPKHKELRGDEEQRRRRRSVSGSSSGSTVDPAASPDQHTAASSSPRTPLSSSPEENSSTIDAAGGSAMRRKVSDLALEPQNYNHPSPAATEFDTHTTPTPLESDTGDMKKTTRSIFFPRGLRLPLSTRRRRQNSLGEDQPEETGRKLRLTLLSSTASIEHEKETARQESELSPTRATSVQEPPVAVDSTTDVGEESSSGGEEASLHASDWAQTLSSKTHANLSMSVKIPSPPTQDMDMNKVDYMILVCKNAEIYAKQLMKKLALIREGKHLIASLHDTQRDLDKQRRKILAVYDAREVSRAADRLGGTISSVFDLLGDIQKASRLFGKKKKFGKRIQALLTDLGTNRNSLLGATSLAIADRPHVLYMMEEEETRRGNGSDGSPKRAELLAKCLEGDCAFYGRGGDVRMKDAYEAYLWAAERGLPEAMFMLAWIHRYGLYGEANMVKCKEWLEQGVERDHAPCMNELALLLLEDAEVYEARYPELADWVRLQMEEEEKNEESIWEAPAALPIMLRERWDTLQSMRRRAMSLLQSASRLGHADAMASLGSMYETAGLFSIARRWYELAAESANNARAQNYLGSLHYFGRGAVQDVTEAVIWFKKSADQGNSAGCNNLGRCHEAGEGVVRDIPRAMDLYRQAIAGGSIHACSNLAYLLAREALRDMAVGDKEKSAPLLQQLRESIDLFRRAADAGIADASYQLGRLYSQGLGIPVDPAAALENFMRAADLGHIAACTCCGDMLYSGNGCSPNPKLAYEYYFAAAKSGDSFAMNALGLMHEEGVGVQRNWRTARMWYSKGADAGCPDAAYNGALLAERGEDPVEVLARITKEGCGSIQSLSPKQAEALRLFERAVDLGHCKAEKDVRRLRLHTSVSIRGV